MTGIIALIPARAGSKSVKDKNIRPFGGKPLLVHSIEHGLQSALIDRVIVSTNSAEYAEIARQAGAEAPFLRPEEFSDDHSTDYDVFKHTLEWLQENEGSIPDIIVHLRPTYPHRKISDIDAAIQILLDTPDIDSVRSIIPAPHTPYKMWLKDDHHRITPVAKADVPDAHNQPRQNLPKTYLQNACIDVVRSSVVLEKHSTTGDKIYGFQMDHHYDIDTEADILHAQRKLDEATGRVPSVSEGAEKTFCFDIDGVIASIVPDNDYSKARPLKKMIAVINRLYDGGHTIILHTARGSKTKIDWKEVTEKQMKDWGVRYHELHFGKPAADIFIDDRAVPVDSLYSDSFQPKT